MPYTFLEGKNYEAIGNNFGNNNTKSGLVMCRHWTEINQLKISLHTLMFKSWLNEILKGVNTMFKISYGMKIIVTCGLATFIPVCAI